MDADIDQKSLLSIDGAWLRDALVAGIHHVIARRDYINRINVFPVPDGDTGTNLAMTMHAILVGATRKINSDVGKFLEQAADHAIDGARGNSGAIFAQFLQGFHEAVEGASTLTAHDYAEATYNGSRSAQMAIARPKEGTMITVIRDYALSLRAQIKEGVEDFRDLLQVGLERARTSLSNTPNQLEVLRKAGVVDAGAQGFVDLLEGIQEYVETGTVTSVLPVGLQLDEDLAPEHLGGNVEDVTHRYCTECVVTRDGLDRRKLRDQLLELNCSSLVLAGTRNKVRVHIHVNDTADVFRICEDFGDVSSRKADDILAQTQTTHSRHGRVAILSDTGADLPEEEMERLHIHLVPLRVNLSDRQFLDKVSLSSSEFYELLRSSPEYPRTSQPPPGDFRRQFEFLTSHFDSVIAVTVSRAMSGTWQAAQAAAKRVDEEQVKTFDSMNASAGQGLLTLFAAEAAAANLNRQCILDGLEYLRPRTRTYALVPDLSYGVRGGRVPKGMKTFTDVAHLSLIIKNNDEGKIGPAGVLFLRSDAPRRFARWVMKRLNHKRRYRLLVAHCDYAEGGEAMRQFLEQNVKGAHSVLLTAAGSSIGAHAGPGSLVVGVQEYISAEEWQARWKEQQAGNGG
ncbi:MAG: DegV family protein [Xanthomonadales bacterium]|nr:DegV family protein [Xanthomonadales bacterium]